MINWCALRNDKTHITIPIKLTTISIDIYVTFENELYKRWNDHVS